MHIYLHVTASFFCLFCWKYSVGRELPEELQPIHSNCYGTHDFRPSCEHILNTVIAPGTTYIGSKLSSTNCPLELSNATEGHVCCTPDYTNDCIIQYHYGNDLLNSFSSGRSISQQPLSVIRDETPAFCNQSSYIDRTTYMYMEYYCIATSKIRRMCTAVSETLQGSLVYLQSNGYPANIPPGDSSCTCSVETSICNATLNLYTIDRRFKSENGTCHQSITLSTDAQWSCNNNAFGIEFVASTQTYLTFEFTNTYTAAGGQFWFGVEGTGATVELELNCPVKEQQYCLTTTTTTTTTTTITTTPTPTTTTMTTTTPTTTTMTTTTPTTTTTTPTTMTTTTTPTPTTTTPTSTPTTTSTSTTLLITSADPQASGSISEPEASNTIVIGVGIGSALIVIGIAIVIGACCWRYKKRKQSKNADEENIVKENGVLESQDNGSSDQTNFDTGHPSDNAAPDPTTKLSIRGYTGNDGIETCDKIDKENKKDILISPEVDLDRKTDKHISYTEDLYVTNGNYTQKALEPLKDINGIGHSTGKYVGNEEKLSLTNGLETPKTLEPHINNNKVSAAYGDRESTALPEITEQERDLEIMETGQFQLGSTINNASEIVEYTEHKKKKKKKKKRRHVMDDEDIHKMNNELDSEMMQEDNSRHKRKKKKRKRDPVVEGSLELSFDYGTEVMERGNDITQLLTNFGNDTFTENDSPDAVPMQLSKINQTHKEEIPMHQWGHFQNKVAPNVDGSDSRTRKKHKKKKRNKVEPEMDNEINNFADDQFVD